MITAHIKPLIKVREAVTSDQQGLASLFHFESYVHRHLDWRSPLDWIGTAPFLVAEQKGSIIGALACPVDSPGVAWIQVFAAKSRFSLEAVWDSLWQETFAFYQSLDKTILAAIPTLPWFSRLLLNSHFQHSHNIVVLMIDHEPLPARQWDSSAMIRDLSPGDLDAVHQLDRLSFEPLWQQSRASLEVALKQANLATVAEIDDKVVGYQISTGGHLGGHLARLAVHPAYRGEYIGFALVSDLLEKLRDHGISRVTVNTQEENVISLNLYEKIGFRKTGEVFKVFTTNL